MNGTLQDNRGSREVSKSMAYWHNQLTRPSVQTQPISLRPSSKLIQKLKRIKRETNMEEGMYRTMYPTGCTAPKFYGLPKIHKTSNPPQANSIQQRLCHLWRGKVIAKKLKPLVGKLLHHIQNTRDFISKVREVTLLPGECLSSYHVTVLFTSVPIDPALNIIKNLLKQDDTE